MSPQRHPNGFLGEFNLPYDPHLPISLAFNRISQQRGWKRGSKRWKKNWNACMNSEYDRLIGSRVASLETWQELCSKVGLEGSFTSISQCKKALAHVHVNLVDLLDTWATASTPTRFRSREALAHYTATTSRYFRRDIAKQDKCLKVLLRRLL